MNTTLQSYLDNGLLYNQVHPTLDLTIWNYTEKVQFEGNWDDITLMCRGLVTDSNGNVVARPFRKFFNIEEGRHTATPDFEVYEKMDGSLIIAFIYQSEWVLCTRGSFTSDQAIAATKYFFENNLDKVFEGGRNTYLFEYIAPWNRIVVDYGEERLVLLGIVDTETGDEFSLDTLRSDEFQEYVGPLDVVKKYDGITDYSLLKGMVKDDAEGFVVKFSNGDRMKVKGVEYIRLHKVMTGLSTTSVWECLSKGDDIMTILKDVPDEFYKKVDVYVNQLKNDYNDIYDTCLSHYVTFRYGKNGEKTSEPTRREYVDYVLQRPRPLQGVLFNMWDGKAYDHIIWKMIKPTFMKL